MLFMVIEHFRNRDFTSVGARFKERGRMIPEGLMYHSSWIDAAGARCFQVMEAPDLNLLGRWTAEWEDLVEFEIIPLVPSADFWSSRAS